VTTPLPNVFSSNDGRVSPYEYEFAMEIMTNPELSPIWSAQDLWGLDREMMTQEGEVLCRLIQQSAGDVQGAFDQYQEDAYDRADAAGLPRSRADAVRLTASNGAFHMCQNLLGLDEL
jgi:hypothetical protein